MSGGIPDIAALGYLPLRHEDETTDIGLRHIVNAVAIKRIDPAGPTLVEEVPQTAGDLLNAGAWRVEGNKRNCPGWSFAWPVQVTKPERASGNGQKSAVRGAEEEQKVRPTRDGGIKADDRFVEKGPAFPSWADRKPKGWTGITIAATNEDKQEDTFHPDALGLVAAEVAGDPDLSTVVLDLNDEDRVDPDRRAHLNSLMRVVREPKTTPSIGVQNGIAIQYGSGRGGRAGYGLIVGGGVAAVPSGAGAGGQGPQGDGRIDSGLSTDSSGRQYAPNGVVIEPGITIGSVGGGLDGGLGQGTLAPQGGPASLACMSVVPGGPVAIPPAGDQHQIGVDRDGNAIFAAHLSTRAIFLGPTGDGPIAFEEGAFPTLTPGNFLTPVHLRFDPATPHVWSALDRPGRGMWRMFAESLLYVPEPEEPPPPTTPTTPDPPPPPTTPVPPRKKKKRRNPPPPPPTTPGGGDVFPPTTTPPSTTPGGGAIDPPPAGGGDGGESGQIPPPRPTDSTEGERPPRRPPGVPSGSIDEETGLPPPPPKETPGGQYEPTVPRGDETSPFEEENDPSLPKDGRIDPSRELDEAPTEYDPAKDPKRNTKPVYTTDPRQRNQLPFAASQLELAVPGLLIRPGSFSCGAPNLRNTVRADEKDVRAHDKTSPIVARLEGAWAKAGADCNPAPPSYTHKPGAARYLCGTASGILAFLPPEVGLEDAATDFAPPGLDVSTLHICAVKGKTVFGSGFPDPTTTLIKSGWKWGARTSDDKFALVSTTSTGADDKTIAFPNRSGSGVIAPSAITEHKLWRADANGDATEAAVEDNGTRVQFGRKMDFATGLGSTYEHIGAPTDAPLRIAMGSQSLRVKASSADVVSFYGDTTGIQLKSTYPLRWSNSAINSSSDAGLARDAAGVVRTTDGTASGFGDHAVKALRGYGAATSFRTLVDFGTPTADKTVSIPNRDLTMIGRAASGTEHKILRFDANGDAKEAGAADDGTEFSLDRAKAAIFGALRFSNSYAEMGADEQLTATTASIVSRKTGATARNLDFEDAPASGRFYLVQNDGTSGNTITVRDYGGALTIAALSAGEWCIAWYDGANATWRAAGLF